MKYWLLTLLVPLALFATTEKQKQALYNSLDPQSVSEHLAYYELYEDEKALRAAWELLSGTDAPRTFNIETSIQGLIELVNKPTERQVPTLNTSDLQTIHTLAAHFPNRQLKGHKITRFSQAKTLESSEVDLARALFLQQFDDARDKVESYEAMIDLMALQIGARLKRNATDHEKIREMNRFIFEEMGYRFPPHSEHAKDIDVYTFLPSVLDSRRGVCLGVSILYLCLSQRLDLPLEIVTPPGHIFVRYEGTEGSIINIETTARGIHIDDKEYLSLNTRSLQKRTLKEVIGMVPFNQAGAEWSAGNYEGVVKSYEMALPFMPDDYLLQELMGYAYLLTGRQAQATALLDKVKDHLPEEAVSKNVTAEDILGGKVDVEGLKILFAHVDETRESLLEKKGALEKALERHPEFRSGWFSLATTWLQLHREKEALKALERYHELHPEDPNAEYILAALYAGRFNENKALAHLKNAERLTAARNHTPEALQALRRQF